MLRMGRWTDGLTDEDHSYIPLSASRRGINNVKSQPLKPDLVLKSEMISANIVTLL